MTTKILALTDALGNLVRFVLLPGQRFDTAGVAPLIDGIEFGALIADKAFDSNDIIADLDDRGAKVVISQHPRRAIPRQIDRDRVGNGLGRNRCDRFSIGMKGVGDRGGTFGLHTDNTRHGRDPAKCEQVFESVFKSCVHIEADRTHMRER